MIQEKQEVKYLFSSQEIKCIKFPLPLTVREAVEVWFPTVKVTVPESALVTPLSVRLCTRPSVLIRFI